jgi:hypothetical protein
MQYNAKGSTGKERFKAAEVARELAGELGEVQVYGKLYCLIYQQLT